MLSNEERRALRVQFMTAILAGYSEKYGYQSKDLQAKEAAKMADLAVREFELTEVDHG